MEEMNQLKVFKADEVNQLLPKLTEMIQELQEKRELIVAQEVEIDALEIVTEAKEDNASPLIHRKIESYNQTVNRFYEIIDEMHEIGCLLKDVDSGLVDFYAIHEGRVVYLCWKLGEKKIRFWHEVGKGYAYRQPLAHEHDGLESSG